jgi:hypothetical protein
MIPRECAFGPVVCIVSFELWCLAVLEIFDPNALLSPIDVITLLDLYIFCSARFWKIFTRKDPLSFAFTRRIALILSMELDA